MIDFNKTLLDKLEIDTNEYVNPLIYDYIAKEFAEFINDGILYEEGCDEFGNLEMVSLETKPLIRRYTWNSFLEEYTGSTYRDFYSYNNESELPETFDNRFDEDYKYMPSFDDFCDYIISNYRTDIIENAIIEGKNIKKFKDQDIIDSFINNELSNIFNDTCMNCFWELNPDMDKLYLRGCELLKVDPIDDPSLLEMKEPSDELISFMKNLMNKNIAKAFNLKNELPHSKYIKETMEKWNEQIRFIESPTRKCKASDVFRIIDRCFSVLKDILSFDIGYEKTKHKLAYKDISELLSENKEKWVSQVVYKLSYYNSLIITHYNIPYKEVFAYEGCVKYIYTYNALTIFESLFLEESLKEKIKPFVNINPKESYKEARKINRKFHIHLGETNTGKTYEAREALKKAKTGMYLAPLRLLALENQDLLFKSGCACSLLTGEEEDLVQDSTHLSATVELCDLTHKYDVCVIDECQLIIDEDRGHAWSQAILGVNADEIHLCAATCAENILIKMIDDCGDAYEIVRHERNTELLIDEESFDSLRDVKDGDALIVFSRKQVLRVAASLFKHGISCSIIYGGLPYETRKKQFEMFLNGKTSVLVSTDAIAMGVNLPIKRIVFLDIYKFDGKVRRMLMPSEIKQIAGRAGRAGIFDVGYVTAKSSDKSFIEKALNQNIGQIKSAKIAFPKILLQIDDSLSNTLKAWRDLADYSFYKKTNIDRQLLLLSELRNYDFDKITQFKLINIPFNEKEDSLMIQWKNYVKSLGDGVCSIKMPHIFNSDDLGILESLYKSLDLYYSFCKTIELEYDNKEVQAKKRSIAEIMHECLVNDIISYKNSCIYCGKELPWDHRYSQCQSCYNSGAYYYY